MKVIVIPDVHLKPWMFHRASELMKEIKAERAVCLMDIVDDWRQQFKYQIKHGPIWHKEGEHDSDCFRYDF